MNIELERKHWCLREYMVVSGGVVEINDLKKQLKLIVRSTRCDKKNGE